MSRSSEMKRLVADGYDRIGAGLLRRRRETPPSGRKQSYLEQLTSGVPQGGWVLDLGCGPGEQAEWLSERFSVAGLDISLGQLAAARERTARASFLLGDMCALPFRPASVDAIAAIYSIIHVPREEHLPLFRALFATLRPGGRLFAVLGSTSWEATEENWLDLGATMYWSHFDGEGELELLREAGFDIQASAIEPDELVGEGAHVFVLAEKPR